MSYKSIRLPAASNNILAPSSNYVRTKWWVKFDSHWLKQDRLTFTYKQVINNYFFYDKKLWSSIQGAYFMLENSLCGAVTLTKMLISENIVFIEMVLDLMPAKVLVIWKNKIIFGAVISSPVHINNKKEDILILGKIPTGGVDNTTLTAKRNILKILLSNRVSFV